MNYWHSIVGHEWAVKQLNQAVTFDRIGHAYLFTGPTQVGRATLALTFAQAVNCQTTGTVKPCYQCRACMLIGKNKHPDLSILSPEISSRGKASIKIDQIRQLQHHLNLTPTEGFYKIALIKQFETANRNAANAFLKTLEEPPPNVLLLLTASDADALLPTISSRCHTFPLRPTSIETIKKNLVERTNVDPTHATMLAHLADGRYGWASAAEQDPSLIEERATQFSYLREIKTGNRVARFALAEQLTQKPEQLPHILQSWLTFWRDLLLLTHNQTQISNLPQRPILQLWATEQESSFFVTRIKMTELALTQLNQNANIRLLIENLLLSY